MKGIKVKKILTLSSLSLLIAACTQTNPATIVDISDSSESSNPSVYSRPPTNISTGNRISNSTYPKSSSSSSSTVQSSSSSGQSVAATNERIVYNRNYDDIPKGGYKGDTYTVKRGDTLFYIAWVTGNDYRSLAAKNNIKEPFAVNVGQVLDVSFGTTVVETKNNVTQNVVTIKDNSNGTSSNRSSDQGSTIQSVQSNTITSVPSNPTSSEQGRANVGSTTATVANISWQWPANGKIIEKFSNASKGIDISGSLGDKVVAAADGRVVYSGNALPGYGNLIIVKHNDDYLTAYAHNQSILVKEQQTVRAGEQIATMGATGTSSVRLHFEIRYKAQSVDPTKYLPK